MSKKSIGAFGNLALTPDKWYSHTMFFDVQIDDVTIYFYGYFKFLGEYLNTGIGGGKAFFVRQSFVAYHSSVHVKISGKGS